MKLRTYIVTGSILAASVLSGCGSSKPSDKSLLEQACKTPPTTATTYDFGYETINSTGQITGIANCGTDGTVVSWGLYPHGSGDQVYVNTGGQTL